MMKKILIGLSIVLLILFLSGCISSITPHKTFNQSFEVYTTNAPFGKYWVHTWGEAVLFSGSNTYSELQETYSVKFMNGDEVLTLLIQATDPRLSVHFTEDNTTMTLRIVYYNSGGYDDDASEWKTYMNGGGSGGEWWSEFEFDLYIPRPELCRLSNDIIKEGT